MSGGYQIWIHKRKNSVELVSVELVSRDCDIMFFTHVNNIEDQTKLLSTILETKNNIRTQREKNRLQKEKLNLQYAMIADPINKQIQSVIKPLQDTTSQFQQDDDAETNDDHVSNNHVDLNNEEAVLPIEDDKREATHTETLSSYDEALRQIKRNNFDNDGLIGLNKNKRTINDMPYEVDGNTLNVHTPSGMKSFEIPNVKTWQILLAKNPNQLAFKLRESNNLPIPALRQYRHIINKLQLLEKINNDNDGSTPTQISRKPKYQLIGGKIGGNIKSYKFAPRPQTQVIPSDPVGLLRKLRVLAAEYRSGNTNLINDIIPFTAEARRIGISEAKLKFLADIPLETSTS